MVLDSIVAALRRLWTKQALRCTRHRTNIGTEQISARLWQDHVLYYKLCWCMNLMVAYLILFFEGLTCPSSNRNQSWPRMQSNSGRMAGWCYAPMPEHLHLARERTVFLYAIAPIVCTVQYCIYCILYTLTWYELKQDDQLTVCQLFVMHACIIMPPMATGNETDESIRLLASV